MFSRPGYIWAPQFVRRSLGAGQLGDGLLDAEHLGNKDRHNDSHIFLFFNLGRL